MFFFICVAGAERGLCRLLTREQQRNGSGGQTLQGDQRDGLQNDRQDQSELQLEGEQQGQQDFLHFAAARFCWRA